MTAAQQQQAALEDFDTQVARVRRVRDTARELGPTTSVLVTDCDALLARAAQVEGEAAMVALYDELLGLQEF